MQLHRQLQYKIYTEYIPITYSYLYILRIDYRRCKGSYLDYNLYKYRIDTKMSDQLNIRVDKDLKTEFIKRAKENDTTATDLLVAFIKQYLGIESKSPTDTIDVEAIEKELSKRLDNRIAELEQRLDSRIDNNKLDDSIDNRIADAISKLDNQLSERLSQLERGLGELDKSTGELIDNELETKLDNRIAEVNNKLDNRIADAISKLDNQLSERIAEQIDTSIDKRLTTELDIRIDKRIEATATSRQQSAVEEAVQPAPIDDAATTPDDSEKTDAGENGVTTGDNVATVEPEVVEAIATATDEELNPLETEVTPNLTPLNQEQLAARLKKLPTDKRPTIKFNSSTVSRRKDDSDFTDWSRQRDPDDIGWRFDDDAKLFYPVG